MCCIFTCCGWFVDLFQRCFTFIMSCIICAAVCCFLLIAIMSGVALGYNYSLTEYIELKETGISVFLKRGIFDDDIKAMEGRRSGDLNEPQVQFNGDNSLEEPLTEPGADALRSGGSLDQSIYESDDNRRYEGSLLKLTIKTNTESTKYPNPTYTQTVGFNVERKPVEFMNQWKAARADLLEDRRSLERVTVGQKYTQTVGFNKERKPAELMNQWKDARGNLLEDRRSLERVTVGQTYTQTVGFNKERKPVELMNQWKDARANLLEDRRSLERVTVGQTYTQTLVINKERKPVEFMNQWKDARVNLLEDRGTSERVTVGQMYTQTVGFNDERKPAQLMNQLKDAQTNLLEDRRSLERVTVGQTPPELPDNFLREQEPQVPDVNAGRRAYMADYSAVGNNIPQPYSGSSYRRDGVENLRSLQPPELPDNFLREQQPQVPVVDAGRRAFMADYSAVENNIPLPYPGSSYRRGGVENLRPLEIFSKNELDNFADRNVSPGMFVSMNLNARKMESNTRTKVPRQFATKTVPDFDLNYHEVAQSFDYNENKKTVDDGYIDDDVDKIPIIRKRRAKRSNRKITQIMSTNHKVLKNRTKDHIIIKAHNIVTDKGYKKNKNTKEDDYIDDVDKELIRRKTKTKHSHRKIKPNISTNRKMLKNNIGTFINNNKNKKTAEDDDHIDDDVGKKLFRIRRGTKRSHRKIKRNISSNNKMLKNRAKDHINTKAHNKVMFNNNNNNKRTEDDYDDEDDDDDVVNKKRIRRKRGAQFSHRKIQPNTSSNYEILKNRRKDHINTEAHNIDYSEVKNIKINSTDEKLDFISSILQIVASMNT